MPVGPYLPGVVKYINFWTGDRDSAITVHWAQTSITDGLTLTQLNFLAEQMCNIVSVFWPPFMTSNQSQAGTYAYDMTSAEGLRGEYAATTAGGGSDAIVPAQVAAVVSFEENRRYRGGHARNYFPGPSASLYSGNQTLSPSAVTDINTALATFLTDLNEVELDSLSQFMVNVHAREIEDKGPPVIYKDPFVMPIVGATVRSVFGTQRKRLERVSRRR